MSDHIVDATGMVALSAIPLEMLQWFLRREQQDGVHTYRTACCGHGWSRGGGYCEDCLRAEIGRRAKA